MDSQLEGLFHEYWEFQIREDPLAASVYYGDHRHDDRLPAAGEADFQRRRDTLQGYLTRLQQFDHSVVDDTGLAHRLGCWLTYSRMRSPSLTSVRTCYRSAS